MATKKVSAAKAAKVLAAVKKQFAGFISPEDGFYGPKLVMDYEDFPAIIWEDGAPYDWPQMVKWGGIEEEFGIKIPSIPDKEWPAGVWTEAINCCAVAILPE